MSNFSPHKLTPFNITALMGCPFRCRPLRSSHITKAYFAEFQMFEIRRTDVTIHKCLSHPALFLLPTETIMHMSRLAVLTERLYGGVMSKAFG